MFNIGTSELIFIAAIALLVLGPERLPKLAKGVGRFFRELRRQTDDVRTAVEREFYKLDDDVESGSPPLTPHPESLPQGSEPDDAAEETRPVAAETQPVAAETQPATAERLPAADAPPAEPQPAPANTQPSPPKDPP